MEKTQLKKLAGAALGVIIGAIVYMSAPPTGLTSEAMRVFGLFLWAAFFWVFDIFPFYVTSMGLAFLFVFMKVTPFEVAFSGYLSTTWWFMLGALGISAALSKCGLMHRFAYNVMRLFAPTYKGQILGLFAATAVVTPIIPSATAKTNMLMPIAKNIADLMGYKSKSRELHGMFLACFTGVTIMSHGFVSSNFFCYFVVEFLPDAEKARFGWVGWFLAAFPQTLIVMLVMAVCVIVLYKPKSESASMSREDIREELTKMGKLDRSAKFTIAILIIAVILWVTEGIHGIPGYQTALMGMLILLASNIIDANDIKTGIPWNVLLMAGVLYGFGNVFKYAGINDYLSVALTPVMKNISGSHYLFIAVIAVATYLIKFVYSDGMAVLAIFGSILVPIAEATGISSWMALYVVMVSCEIWSVIYQNHFFVMGYGAFGGDENLNFGSLAKMSYIYMAANIVTLWMCVPYWRMLGIIT